MSVTIEEMWNRLAAHQPFADEQGYGPEWARFLEERTEEAAVALDHWSRGAEVEAAVYAVKAEMYATMAITSLL
jgi:hypothetical protein